MNKNSTTAKGKGSLVGSLLAEITPIRKKQVAEKMLLAARLANLIQNKGWNKSTFAQKMGREPSEVTKWLSGSHNFTYETLVEMAFVLEIPMAALFEQEQAKKTISVSMRLRKEHFLVPITLFSDTGNRKMLLEEPAPPAYGAPKETLLRFRAVLPSKGTSGYKKTKR